MCSALGTELSKTSGLTIKFPPNLLQTAIKNVRSGNNMMQSAQATPISSHFPFDHQGSVIDSSDNDPSQSTKSSNDQSQHSPTTLELKRLKAELEERHRIATECMKQNVSMQHQRDLQIVRYEAQRRLDDALSQVRLSEEKATAQSRKIESLQFQMDQLSQPIRQQQQQTPPNIATPQYNMQHQHNFSLPPPTHTCSIHTNTHRTCSTKVSITLDVLDRFDKSMVQQDNVLHKSLRQSVTASKEHYLSSAKPCDGKMLRTLAYG